MENKETPDIPLNNFQQWMLHLLMDPYQQTGAASERLPDSLKGSGLEAVIQDTKKLSAREHLAIYQRSYIARLRHCMAQQFSALEHALGADLFRGFADAYLSEHPSRNYNLMGLGSEFANYLERNRPDRDSPEKEDWPDFMIELARLEYTLNMAFEEQAEEDSALATNETPEEHLQLAPVCYPMAFTFPVRWYYSEFKKGNDPDIPAKQPSYCVILRHEYQLALYDLHQEQYELLCYLKSGLRLRSALLRFEQEHPQEVEQFRRVWPEWKRKWIEVNLFVDSRVVARIE